MKKNKIKFALLIYSIGVVISLTQLAKGYYNNNNNQLLINQITLK